MTSTWTLAKTSPSVSTKAFTASIPYEEFDEIQVFTGETQSILSTIVRNIAKEDENGKKHRVADGIIDVKGGFPILPWTKLKKYYNQWLRIFRTSMLYSDWSLDNFCAGQKHNEQLRKLFFNPPNR